MFWPPWGLVMSCRGESRLFTGGICLLSVTKTLSPALEVVVSIWQEDPDDSVLFCINIEPVLVHLEEVPRDLFMVRIREASRGVHGRC